VEHPFAGCFPENTFCRYQLALGSIRVAGGDGFAQAAHNRANTATDHTIGRAAA
jgi:hypothetical protein